MYEVTFNLHLLSKVIMLILMLHVLKVLIINHYYLKHLKLDFKLKLIDFLDRLSYPKTL